MNKAFTRIGLLGVAAVALLIFVGLAASRPAKAQGGGTTQEPDLAMISGPVQLSYEPGQKLQMNMYLYSPAQGTKRCATAFDFLIDVSGPTGHDTLRKTVVFPHVLETSGRITRLTIAQNGNNWDLYKDGVMVRAGILNGLPPGIPVENFVVNSHTSVLDRIPDNQTELGGTMQCTDANGKTGVFGKSKELTGHVTLIK